MPKMINDPIVSREKIIFPPPHMKLDWMKHFVRALNTDGECFQHIVLVLPAFSFENIKAGVFDWLQICTLVRDQDFVKKMNDKERGT